MTDSIIPFRLNLVSHIWTSLPFPLMTVPTLTQEPGIPLIRFEITFMLPMENLLVCWPPLPITRNFLYQIMMILKLNMLSLVTTLSVTGWKEDNASGSLM